ncbi:MAG: hypothetical protein H6524_04395 [Actinobacteria bacterium]|nr:hypothetical protein [Actinomycetota bacterium]
MIVDLLVEHPVILFFVYLAVGSVLGAIRIRGVLIGPAAVLFAALAISAFDEQLALPAIVGQIGLVLFAYCIGVSSGPSFFASLRTGGRAVLLVIVTLLLAAAVAVVAGRFAGLNPDLIAGAYTGALTNTPALAAATEQLDSAPIRPLATRSPTWSGFLRCCGPPHRRCKARPSRKSRRSRNPRPN